jgi:transaldolase
MVTTKFNEKLVEDIFTFVRQDFHPGFGQKQGTFPSNALWRKMTQLGTELWLDTGDITGAEKLWTREFTALTTNNTLLNKEVQTGSYDDFIVQAGKLLSTFPDLDESRCRLEMAFILNARHGLRLVEKFDAYVSVEEHTDLASQVDLAVDYALRYHEICPERFIIKIPFTPAGLLVTRKLSDQNIPVNHTLGFSARQNYVIARLARPAYVNVFMGRLNSFVVDNALGDGAYVGEKATLASQTAIRKLRKTKNIPTRQIGASFRSGPQVRDLAGMDVMTIPVKVAQEFLDLNLSPSEIADKTAMQYKPSLNKDADPARLRLETLWDIDKKLVACLDDLEQEHLTTFTPADLVGFFADHGCGDILVKWTHEENALSTREGKIPKLENWADALAQGRVGLDSLLNLAGLNSFTADQKAMDGRVTSVLTAKK